MSGGVVCMVGPAGLSGITARREGVCSWCGEEIVPWCGWLHEQCADGAESLERVRAEHRAVSERGEAVSRGSVPTAGIKAVFCVRDQCGAIQYNGRFELGFLRHGEAVGAASGLPGGAQVITADGEEILLEKGDWLVRKSDGGLERVDAERFAVDYVDPSRPAGSRG